MVNNVTTRLDNIEEAYRNDFGNISSEFTSIKTSIEALRNEMIQRYAITQRLQVEFDQLSTSFVHPIHLLKKIETVLSEFSTRKRKWGRLMTMRLKL